MNRIQTLFQGADIFLKFKAIPILQFKERLRMIIISNLLLRSKYQTYGV